MKFLIFFLTVSCALAQEFNRNDLSAGIALGGPEVLATIREAETVTAQRIDSKLADSPLTAPEHPELIILAPPFPVASPEAAALKEVFTRGTTYLSPSKTCEFRANVRYGFLAQPDRKVEIVLCFGCGEMEVWFHQKFVSFGPFDGGYGEILALTKRLFPDDEFLAKFTPEAFAERAERMKAERPK